jgi:hypothetical protein
MVVNGYVLTMYEELPRRLMPPARRSIRALSTGTTMPAFISAAAASPTNRNPPPMKGPGIFTLNALTGEDEHASALMARTRW